MVGEELLESKDKIAFKDELEEIQQSLLDELDNQKKEMKTCIPPSRVCVTILIKGSPNFIINSNQSEEPKRFCTI